MNQFKLSFFPVNTASASPLPEVREAGTTEVSTTSEEHAAEGLFINPAVVGFQALNFVGLLIVLHFILFKPLLKLLKDRSKTINEGVENATKARVALDDANSMRQDILKKAHVQGQEIMESSNKTAEEIKANILSEARAEAAKMIQEANVLAKMERAKMMDELKDTTSKAILEVTEKILREKMDHAKDMKLIQENLNNYLS